MTVDRIERNFKKRNLGWIEGTRASRTLVPIMTSTVGREHN